MILAALRPLLSVGLTCAALVLGAITVGGELPNGVIAYARTTPEGSSDLYLLDLATRVNFNLTRTPFQYEDHPVWSPDGQQIAYQRIASNRSQVCVIGADRRCFSPVSVWDHMPLWTADGRSLAFLGADSLLFVRDESAGSLISTGSSDRLIFDPVWSPDGSRIAYIESAPRSLQRSLYIAQRDFSGIQVVATGDFQVSAPSWSPDGQQIALMAEDSVGNRDIYALDVASGALRQVSHSGRDIFPSWSPDGAHIVFLSLRGGDFDLILINADGTGERALTANDVTDQMPVWSPDGSQIVFVSNRSGSYQLYLLDIASGDTQRLTFDDGAHLNPAWHP